MEVGTTQNQALVSAALQQLGLVYEPSGVMGSPHKLKVTDDTVKRIQDLKGKAVVVGSDGSVSVQ